MAFTLKQKKRLVDGTGLTENDLYVALGTGTPGRPTELTGHGYSRGRILAAQIKSNASGVVSIPAGQTIYTANDGSAQTSTIFRLYRSAAGGESDAVAEWIKHSVIAAPLKGQAVQTGTITITP